MLKLVVAHGSENGSDQLTLLIQWQLIVARNKIYLGEVLHTV